MADEPCAPGAPGGQRAPRPEPRLSSQLLPELYTFVARVLFYLAPVYLAGYLGLSITWLLLGALLWMWWRRNRRGKLGRLAAAFQFLDNERQFISRELRGQHLPAWIHFPDVERVEWANKIISQIWPYLSMIMENKFREKLEPKIREKSSHLRTFTFTKLYFGQKCPRVNGVKAHTNKRNRRQVVLDLQICYIGDCEISVELRKIQAGVNGIQLQGTLRVILEPLLVDKPFVGAVTVFFLQKPHLQINWTGLTNLLDAPGINEISDSLLEDLIATHLVLPNRMTVPVKKGLDVTNLLFPLPCGVIRVHLLEAEKLAQKDNFLGIRGKSDPYAKVSIGLQQFRSKTIYKNLNPTWNEVFEFVVYEVPGQDLEVDLYDEDPDRDDFLGSLQICLGDVMTNRVVDEWFVLNDTTSGRLHLRLEWLSLIANPEALIEDQGGLSTAILVVFLESACNLPRNPFDYLNGEYRAKKLSRFTKNKVSRDPSSYVKLSVGKKTQMSKTCPHSKDPVWSQMFSFFVYNVAAEELHLKVLDDTQECALGVLEFPLCQILPYTDLTLEQRFQLDHSGLDSLISMRLVLRRRGSQAVEAGNLTPCTSSGADPYVRIYLLPERRWASRKKTSVKRKTLEPLFDETFEFFVPMEEVKKRSLDVAVKNSRPLGSHRRKELGKVSTRGTLGEFIGGTPCRNSDGIIWLLPELASRTVDPHWEVLCVYLFNIVESKIDG
ncbi:extended synaptotagmin-3 isoform X3 [Vulpes vulpes]|uniref:Extended synaptotagmin-3 isoform X3 n=1 Tax=Vulpes vulpes TaxID=9627 RepID=A0ABM4XYE2_VULVU